MFTLKIKRVVYERHDDSPPTEFDLTEVFVEADRVTALSWVPPERQGQIVLDYAGLCDDFTEYTFGNGKHENEPARLLMTQRDGVDHWYLASHAWLMGSNGRTIERLA
jgi:hypothetical protein